jgi:hypothetical protein
VGDVESLAAKLEAVMKKPLHRVDYDMSKYNWDVIAQQVCEIYESMEN